MQYFLKQSGIPDDKDARGITGRLEAEDARLTGYKPIDVKPWEDASAGKAVSVRMQGLLGRVDVERRGGKVRCCGGILRFAGGRGEVCVFSGWEGGRIVDGGWEFSIEGTEWG